MDPKCVVIFSGKRKSGKDFITEKLIENLGNDAATIVRISAPIKKHWAELHNLDLDQLLDATAYKEQHRLAMIEWSEKERARDYGIFCRSAAENAKGLNKPVWIVSDARRKSDLKWFGENYGDIVRTVRVFADDQIRMKRGWKFTAGVDDVASECDLDDVTDWSWQVYNNGSSEDITNFLADLEAWIKRSL
ncbi:phosphomevalonate kinase [Neocloeon triangulifer]|uniref:phosphomevalonate kinase n=1 Tax=Neocloeon triangulifer TaxID=2078957 RepID=UPI00286F9590|nr:phosphomevalonate kinase [Neocloeon triangulifer]